MVSVARGVSWCRSTVLISCLFLVFETVNGTPTSLIDPIEKRALLHLYDTTGGETKWTQVWDLSTDPCVSTWPGVTCNAQGHVIGLEMENFGLVGHMVCGCVRWLWVSLLQSNT
jgi:hypothetical protein